MKTKSFVDLKTDQVSAFKAQILKKLELNKYPLGLLEKEAGYIESQLTTTHDSNIAFTEVFFRLQDKSIENKFLNHIEVCEEYCKENQLINSASALFFPKLFALYEIRFWLHEKSAEMEEVAKEAEVEAKEIQEGEYTLTRKLIALEILLEAAGHEIEFGKSGINKTKIAEFLHFLLSKDIGSKDIRDSSIYKRVKTTWNKIEEAKPENLQYVSDQFASIGLGNLTERLNQIIKSQKKKEI